MRIRKAVWIWVVSPFSLSIDNECLLEVKAFQNQIVPFFSLHMWVAEVLAVPPSDMLIAFYRIFSFFFPLLGLIVLNCGNGSSSPE